MGCAWNRGHLEYFGKRNDRGGRQRSKILKGMKINFRKLQIALTKIENEIKFRHN
jgi:hypothetical protein